MGQWEDCEVVERDPDLLSGAWVFRGTRVPISSLFENLKDGVTADEYLNLFPGVNRSQVERVLEHEMAAAGSSAS
jgi:uncharacterized protein (DUF433 family)